MNYNTETAIVGKFIHRTRVLLQSHFTEDVFFATARVQGFRAGEKLAQNNLHTIMTRGQFVDALIYLASLRMEGSGDVSKAFHIS
jgi:hypothetical protein